MRAAVYARVSTLDQEPENQLQEIRRYVQAREWTAVEYVDRGVSGAKDRRPALDDVVRDARRRRFDVLVCWPRSTRAQSETSDYAARRPAGAGDCVRQSGRRHRRDDAGRQAADAYPGSDRGVRAG